MTLIEVLLFSAVLGVMTASGAVFGIRQASSASDLAAYEQAVLAAQQVLEFRRARGRLPREDEIKASLAAVGKSREARLAAREIPFHAAGLVQVSATVTWKRGPAFRGGRAIVSAAARRRQ